MAIQLEPGDSSYRIARADSYSAQGKYKMAMADYNDAIRLEPQNPATWVARGNEWRRDLKLDRAIADYSRAIELDPRYAPAYVARGYVWKQRRAFDKAIEEFTNLIRLEPQNALAHQALAQSCRLATISTFVTASGRLTRRRKPVKLPIGTTSTAWTRSLQRARKWGTLSLRSSGKARRSSCSPWTPRQRYGGRWIMAAAREFNSKIAWSSTRAKSRRGSDHESTSARA